jgi:hypothetical protein
LKRARIDESIAVLNFSGGELIVVAKELAQLDTMKQAAAKRGRDIKAVFGDNAPSSNFALRAKVLNLTPRDFRLTWSPRETLANCTLLLLKRIWTTTAKGGLYSFQTGRFRGFQEGSSAQNDIITVYAFDEQDREIKILIGAGPHAQNKLSQAEINRVIFSLRTALSSSAD